MSVVKSLLGDERAVEKGVVKKGAVKNFNYRR
jgi:hypothetical protein